MVEQQQEGRRDPPDEAPGELETARVFKRLENLYVHRSDSPFSSGLLSMSQSALQAGACPRAIIWRNVRFYLAVHAIAALAFFPWFFSWTGVLVCIASIYLVGMMGIIVGFHRLLTHRSFSCPMWVERTLSILGVSCGQGSPTYWVAVHRRHHHYADQELDPHSPRRGFFWGHVGWAMLKRDDLDPGPLMDRYAKDLRRDPFQAWLVRHDTWVFVMFATWVVYFIAGFGVALLTDQSIASAAQFGLSLLVWGAAVRTVIVLHFAWLVNSVDHLWGYRRYNTPDNSRNNPWLGFLTYGDGWHNNHHADPRSARHGHKWWEIDLAWIAIRVMMALGMAKNPRLPSPLLATRFSVSGSQPALDDFEPEDIGTPT
ncbi:MAG TPA: fatty acid desaturase [Xanthobacteraceae bacterium]|nr:fatty acid desaturase [Xanthobacteraceae bacterium]